MSPTSAPRGGFPLPPATSLRHCRRHHHCNHHNHRHHHRSRCHHHHHTCHHYRQSHHRCLYRHRLHHNRHNLSRCHHRNRYRNRRYSHRCRCCSCSYSVRLTRASLRWPLLRVLPVSSSFFPVDPRVLGLPSEPLSSGSRTKRPSTPTKTQT